MADNLWVIVYQWRGTSRAVFQQTFQEIDSGIVNPEMAQGWRPTPLRQDRVPRAFLDLLYRYNPDTSFSNPSTPLSTWKPRPLTQYPLPRGVRYLYWNTAYDTSVSNPSTPASWVNPRLQQTPVPRALIDLLYRFTRGHVESSTIEQFQPWARRSVPRAFGPRPAFYFGQDQSQSNDETPLGWTPMPLRASFGPRIALYFSQDQSQSNDEGGLTWQPRPLRQPYVTSARAYFSTDESQSNDETPASWQPRPLPLASIAVHRSLYWSLDTGQGTEPENEEQVPSWQPRALRSGYDARPSLYFVSAVDGEVSEGGGTWTLQRVRSSALRVFTGHRWTTVLSSVTPTGPADFTITRRHRFTVR